MTHENICKECGKKFLTIRKTRKFCGENCYHNYRKIELKKYTLNCNKCGAEYILYLSETNYLKGKYKKNCNIKCSNSRIMTDDIKKQISKSNTGKVYLSRRKEKIVKIKNRNAIINKCAVCGKEFEYNRKKKCCSNECVSYLLKIGGSNGGKNSKQRKRSKNEIYFGELCQEKFNVIFNDTIFNGWDADIILPDYKLAVLWNGNWHYKKITKNHSLIQVQNRDKIKINEIIKYGYIPYIIEDKGKFNKKFVQEKFDEFIKYMGV